MPTIDLIYFDAGGGHRAAATALQSIIEKDCPDLEPRLMHLRDVLAPVDVFQKVLRIDLQEIYNTMLRKGWTWGSGAGLRGMQWVIARCHRREVELLEQWWRGRAPDMAVSLIPNFNRALYDAWRRVAPLRPYVTVLTDIADYPPAFWIERQAQYFVCGSPRARQQALALGHPPERVYQTSGMILQPRFYDLPELDVAAERTRLGLEEGVPTGIVLFGGYGSMVMDRIVDALEPLAGRLQLILIAGRNARLEQALRAGHRRLRRHVVGFTSEVPYYMRLADFFVGKPGPGSLSEAVHLGLPCITVRNSRTLPQERYNADWLVENGYGEVLASFAGIRAVVERWLDEPARLERMRAATRRSANRALFEVPGILHEILARGA